MVVFGSSTPDCQLRVAEVIRDSETEIRVVEELRVFDQEPACDGGLVPQDIALVVPGGSIAPDGVVVSFDPPSYGEGAFPLR